MAARTATSHAANRPEVPMPTERRAAAVVIKPRNWKRPDVRVSISSLKLWYSNVKTRIRRSSSRVDRTRFGGHPA